jgi:hypothetical protein
VKYWVRVASLIEAGSWPWFHERMPSIADQTFWLLTTSAEAFVVCLFIMQGLFRKFLLFNSYLVFSVATSILRYHVFSRFGVSSLEYFYIYFYTDALLTLLLFLSIFELSVRLVGTRMPRRRVVSLSGAALLATAWFSYSVVSLGSHRLITHFPFEFSQNTYFLCCLAVVLLWVWKVRNDPEDWLAARFVNVLTVYFSLIVLGYGVHQLAPHLASDNNLYPMAGAWLPVGCGFALASYEPPR